MAKTAITPVKQPTSKFAPLDVSSFITKNDGHTIDSEGVDVPNQPYLVDKQGNRIVKNVSQETLSNDYGGQGVSSSDPVTTYDVPIKYNGQDLTATYDDQGNFKYGTGKEFYQNGHHWVPIIDAQGNVNYQNADPSGGFGDFLKTIAPLAIGIFAPELLPSLGAAAAPVLNAGVGLLTGQDPTTILKNAGLSYLGGQAASGVTSGLTDTLGSTAANVVGKAVGSEIASGGKADPVQALLSGGLSAGTSAILQDIPGFSGLDKGTQALVTNAVSNTLRTGKLDPVSLAQAAFKAGTAAMANSTNTPTQSEFNKANEDFLATLAPYLSSTEFSPDTRGDWDEVSGKFVPNPNGGTTYGQINPQTSGNVNNMKDWSFDNKSGQWTRVDPVTGETVTYDYKTPITGTAQTGADIENKAGAAPSSPVSSTPKAGTPTAGTSTSSAPAAASTASPTVTRLGADPLEVMKLAGLNDVAHIKSFKELFGHDLFGGEPVPASSAQDQNVPEADVLKALEDPQNYASGGDVHALLQLLRS